MTKLAVFDLDGTLLYTIKDIADATNYALERSGFAQLSVEEVTKRVGYGVRDLLLKSLPDNFSPDDERFKKMSKDYMDYYTAHQTANSTPYPGIPELIQKLKGNDIKVAVLSNKTDEFTKYMVEHYFPDTFDIVLGQRPGIAIKPDPESLFEIINHFEVNPEETAYVGDSETDIKVAIAAGVKPIGVTWGYRSKKVLKNAGGTIFADNTDELFEIIGN